MPSAVVDTAVKTRLAASWSTTVVVGGLGPSDPPDTLTEPPEDVSAFLAVQYPVVNGEKPVLRGKFLEEGAIRLVLNVKRTKGQAQGLTWSDSLATLFREYKNDAGFETFTPSAPIINDANDDGNWMSFSVIVPYRYQFNG